MVVPILAIERSKDGIDSVKERPSDVAKLVCQDLRKGKKVIKKFVHVRQYVGVLAVHVRLPL